MQIYITHTTSGQTPLTYVLYKIKDSLSRNPGPRVIREAPPNTFFRYSKSIRPKLDPENSRNQRQFSNPCWKSTVAIFDCNWTEKSQKRNILQRILVVSTWILHWLKLKPRFDFFWNFSIFFFPHFLSKRTVTVCVRDIWKKLNNIVIERTKIFSIWAIFNSKSPRLKINSLTFWSCSNWEQSQF